MVFYTNRCLMPNIDKLECIECGFCSNICPKNASQKRRKIMFSNKIKNQLKDILD